MLGTYFVLILAMFIVMVVGAVLGYTGNNIGAHGTYKHSLDFRVKIKFCGHSCSTIFVNVHWVSAMLMSIDYLLTQIKTRYRRATYLFGAGERQTNQDNASDQTWVR